MHSDSEDLQAAFERALAVVVHLVPGQVPFLVLIAACIVWTRWAPSPLHLLEGVAIFAVVMLYAQVVWFFFERHTDGIRARIKPLVLETEAAKVATPTHV